MDITALVIHSEDARFEPGRKCFDKSVVACSLIDIWLFARVTR